MEYPPFNIHTRAETLARLSGGEESSFDAVIVGGGIVGAGLARELAIRGISSLLVEKGDFASGTSSRSSKLIHGGLRYLEMADFHLVFEALAERHWLITTHPHLVKPVEFNVPIYGRKKAPPGSRMTALIGLGLFLYDGLSFFKTPFFHGRHVRKETLKLFPLLKEEGLKGSYYYPDAMMMDDELVLETLLDAHRRGGLALNYVKASDVELTGGEGDSYRVNLQDQLPLEKGEKSKIFSVKAKEVIVCVGPWTELFGSHVVGGAGRKLKPSKGIHLIIPWNRFPVEQCLVMYAPDGRIVFCIPRKDLGKGAEVVIVGTTDSPCRGDPGEVSADSADIHYLLKILGSYFPEARITLTDIIMTYAGVRPLLDTGEASEAKTSREHEIWRNPAGVVFMAGGKYTTFRKISQELARFAFPKSRENNCESQKPLSMPADYEKRSEGKPLWGRFTDRWLKWKLEHHLPCTLDDLIFRRFPLWMGGKKVVESLLPEVVEQSRSYLGWSEVEGNRQIQKTKELIQKGTIEWITQQS